MDIGYARGSPQDRHPALQLDAPHATGCAKVFVEQVSGAQRDRPQLQVALDYARPGDTLSRAWPSLNAPSSASAPAPGSTPPAPGVARVAAHRP
jgi:resolvase-like protein